MHDLLVVNVHLNEEETGMKQHPGTSSGLWQGCLHIGSCVIIYCAFKPPVGRLEMAAHLV
jgi:hypothetical protein